MAYEMSCFCVSDHVCEKKQWVIRHSRIVLWRRRSVIDQKHSHHSKKTTEEKKNLAPAVRRKIPTISFTSVYYAAAERKNWLICQGGADTTAFRTYAIFWFRFSNWNADLPTHFQNITHDVSDCENSRRGEFIDSPSDTVTPCAPKKDVVNERII